MYERQRPRETLEDYKELCEIQKNGIKNLTILVRRYEKEIKRLNGEIVSLKAGRRKRMMKYD